MNTENIAQGIIDDNINPNRHISEKHADECALACEMMVNTAHSIYVATGIYSNVNGWQAKITTKSAIEYEAAKPWPVVQAHRIFNQHKEAMLDGDMSISVNSMSTIFPKHDDIGLEIMSLWALGINNNLIVDYVHTLAISDDLVKTQLTEHTRKWQKKLRKALVNMDKARGFTSDEEIIIVSSNQSYALPMIFYVIVDLLLYLMILNMDWLM